MHSLILPLLLAALTPVTTITARREGRLIYVPVRVNGQGPFWFCFDSGASHSIVDPVIVRQLGLKATAPGTTSGTGRGGVAYRRVPPLVLTVGKVEIHAAEPWEIDLSGVPIPKWVHGLIGADLIESYAVELDPDRARLRLFDAKTFTPPRGAVSIPLEVDNHRFFLEVVIDVNDKETVKRRLRIDTGSEDSVGDESAKRAQQTRTSTLGHGLGQDYQSVSGRFAAVYLGPFTTRGVWGPAIEHSAIGMEMLRRFTVTFDAAHRKLHLVPNGHLREPVPPPGR
jgi:hypothetical protein